MIETFITNILSFTLYFAIGAAALMAIILVPYFLGCLFVDMLK